MADTIIKRWNGSAWVEDYPKTTHTQIVASGTPNSTTFLRGDGSWSVPAGVDSYVNITGDTMTGALTVNNNLSANRYYQNANGVPTGNLGTPTVTEMALFDEQFYNQTAFYDISRLKFYSSTDGTTWTEITTITDGQKRTLVGGDNGGGVTIPNLTPYYRIEITNNGNYVFLNALYLYMTTSSHATSVKIKARRRSDLTFVNFASSNSTVNLWPGHVYLPFSTIPYLTGGSSSGHYDIVHIDFQPIWSGDPTYGTQPIFIQKLQIWGGYPAGKRNVFSTDENANVAFPGTLSGTRLISTIATGTAPLSVTSTTAVTNLNADLVDGLHSSSLVQTTGDQSIGGTKTFTGNVNISGTLDLTNAGVIGALDLSNNSIVGVNNITITDPGPSEGIQWSGGNAWAIYESPNDLTTNSGGNLQIVQSTTRRATFNTSGQLEIPVSTGTAPFAITSTTAVTNLNADTVDGFHAAGLSKRVSLAGQVQTTDYRKSVIALCELTNTNPSANSYSIGMLTFHRTNGLNAPVLIQIAMEKLYNVVGANYTSFVQSGDSFGDNIQYIKFQYNGVWYGGIEFFFNDATLSDVTFHGESNFAIFGLDYFNTQTSTVINAEINSSITVANMTAENDLFINNNKVWNAQNDGAASGLDADLLDGNHAAAFALASHTHAIADVTNLQTSLDAKINTSARNAANGVAPLDATSKVPVANLPDFITGAGRGFYLVGTISGAVSLSAATTGLVAQLVALSGGDYKNMYGYMWTAAAEVTLTWTDQTTLGPVYQYHVLTPGDEGDSTSPVTLEAGDMIVFTKYSNTAGNGDDQEFTFSVINSSDPRFANYLPLTGGTLSGSLNVNSNTTLGSSTFGVGHTVTINTSVGDVGVVSIKNSAATITGRGSGVSLFSSSATAMGSLTATTNNASDLSKALVRLSSTDNLRFMTDASDRMTILSDGNIGIGTTAPAVKLHVAGGTRIVGQLNVMGDAETKRVWIDFEDNNDMGTIQVIQDGVSYKNLALQPDGNNVGIGTRSPGEKLEVVGNAKATRLISTQATGTAPLTVASTTAVTNLNADLLDGNHGSAFALLAGATFTGDVYAPRFIANPSSGGSDTAGAWGISDYDDKLSAVRDYISDTYYPIYHSGNKPGVADISATGSPGATTFLRGDGTWANPDVFSYASLATSTSRQNTTYTTFLTSPTMDANSRYEVEVSVIFYKTSTAVARNMEYNIIVNNVDGTPTLQLVGEHSNIGTGSGGMNFYVASMTAATGTTHTTLPSQTGAYTRIFNVKGIFYTGTSTKTILIQDRASATLTGGENVGSGAGSYIKVRKIM